MTLSGDPIPVERWHKRHRKVRRDKGGRTRILTSVPFGGTWSTYRENIADGELLDHSGHPDTQSLDTGELLCKSGDEILDKDDRQSDSGEEARQPTRRSGRNVKPPSRFANAVMIDLQFGRFCYTQPIWNTMQTLQDLPGTNGIVLEQDFTSTNFLSKPEISKLRELYMADSFMEDWDPDTEIEKVIKHRHTRYVRRIPGKHTYSIGASPITTKGVRVFVQFFSGDRRWLAMEAARGDNPIPLIEYSMRNHLWSKSDMVCEEEL
jgi:hypothetical protein